MGAITSVKNRRVELTITPESGKFLQISVSHDATRKLYVAYVNMGERDGNFTRYSLGNGAALKLETAARYSEKKLLAAAQAFVASEQYDKIVSGVQERIKDEHGEVKAILDSNFQVFRPKTTPDAPPKGKHVDLKWLAHNNFIGGSQCQAIGELLRGEEGQWFADKMAEIRAIVEAMPATGETGGRGTNATVHLHYFLGNMDWHITEKDSGAEGDTQEDHQSQAYGLANLGFGGELGYISLKEITENNAELDLHWTPKTLSEVDDKGEDGYSENETDEEWADSFVE